MVEPGGSADIGQDGGVANVAPFVEVGGEQTFDNAVLLALLAGQPDQAMGVDGVRGALHLVMVEHEPLRPSRRGDLRVERLGALPRPELGRAIGAPVEAGLGYIGVEFEGAPSDERCHVWRERRDHAVQSPLGNPAPGADGVGDHLDGERRFGARCGLDVIQGGGGASVDAANSTFQDVVHTALHSAL